MITNNQIEKLFKLTGSLLELHDANPFKTRSFQNAVFKIDNLSQELTDMTKEEIAALDGFGKGLVANIEQIKVSGSFEELEQLLADTPEGVVQMLGIKGIGPKKIRTVWKELGIENPKELLEACEQDKISGLKGFGKKTQQTIMENIVFIMAQEGKKLYAEALPYKDLAENLLSSISIIKQYHITGDIRRQLDIVENISFVVECDSSINLIHQLNSIQEFEIDSKTSGPFTLRGKISNAIGLEIHLTDEKAFYKTLHHTSSSPAHLAHIINDKTIREQINKGINSEEEAYTALGINYIAPEHREGYIEFNEGFNPNSLVKNSDLKGILHNHSTYSDGKNTLREMAIYTKEQGYEYLGISDHSQSAFYASGLKEDEIIQQHQEIDQLNQELGPFKIFKGIESDILNDGGLDYPDDILKTFDFIVSSVHSNLKMDKAKATERTIKAVENPYTTILGHMTGRLLLRREGFPLDWRKIVDACASNNVMIEINANPWRLDIDWRWLDYTLNKGVKICINPDAHETAGLHDMKYGVITGRKGGLTKEMTFNALGVDEVDAYFKNRIA